jgi:hypothetical protein
LHPAADNRRDTGDSAFIFSSASGLRPDRLQNISGQTALGAISGPGWFASRRLSVKNDGPGFLGC